MTTTRTPDQALPGGRPRTTMDIALWTLQLLMALAFVAAALPKLFASPDRAALFDAALGTGSWFRYLIGSLEVLGALLLVVPGKAAFGAVLLAWVMVGAVVAHLTVLHTPPTAALVLFTLAALIVWGRRSQVAGLLGAQR